MRSIGSRHNCKITKDVNVSFRICRYYHRSEASDRVIFVSVHKICTDSPRICQSYRGFAHVGRSGPQTVRSGQKVDGKIRYSLNPNQRTLRKNVSIIGGDLRSFNIYISPNYFAAWVERSKNPWVALPFCVGSRAVWRFSAGKTNTIEEVRCKVSEV